MEHDDASQRADRLIAEGRTRWPRWRNPADHVAPRWFRGGELDLLTPVERYASYEQARGANPNQTAMQIGALVILTPSLLHGVDDPAHRTLTLVLAGVVLAAWTATWLLRRHTVVKTARQRLRDSADWPQRLERARQA